MAACLVITRNIGVDSSASLASMQAANMNINIRRIDKYSYHGPRVRIRILKLDLVSNKLFLPQILDSLEFLAT